MTARTLLSISSVTLVAVFSSVLFSSHVYAESLDTSVQSPLVQEDLAVQEQHLVVSKKANELNNTAQTVQSLQTKKQQLAQQLEAQKKAIADLQAKIAAKKAADAQAAQAAQVAQTVQVAQVAPTPAPVQTQSYTAPASSGYCVTGYSTGDYYLDKIINYESSGNSCATNSGDCFGLLQACPGAPLRAACGGDPSCQIAWFQANKTGGRSWAEVWQHELDYGWW